MREVERADVCPLPKGGREVMGSIAGAALDVLRSPKNVPKILLYLQAAKESYQHTRRGQDVERR